MLKFTLPLATSAILASSSAMADGHAALMGYALAGDGQTLVTMASLAAPEDVMTFDLANTVDAIAYRPVTGDLLGFAKSGAVYTIDPMTGEMTDLNATFMDDAMIGEGAVAFDFNNAIDAVRAVGADGTNLVYFPEGFGDNDERAGSVRRFTDTFYVDGDTNAGTEPLIYANAYTNAISGAKASSTFQYALDARTNALVSLANNAGELTTVGAVTIDGAAADLVSAGGFDIISPEEGTDLAFAILQLDGSDTSGLYGIDLETGAATLMADLGATGFTGFAVSAGGM
ncbi:DUF4394 domain-containing protein [Pseudooctadecabacter jejudonensis]|uniref:DUF4394 domain-containing protein n=1 Tax=Pseudooctadecabacter jejudonensis TaxID=1391910 RepID=A0A1Y5SX95_9RHOB|nr:DUF4394 domain-containing protein [Pseudooctadecabacter jejudonensis]SLN50574.1 hypothetical protein PSJ8397_02641 [Pseudooctadecabacter jejudonensis]